MDVHATVDQPARRRLRRFHMALVCVVVSPWLLVLTLSLILGSSRRPLGWLLYAAAVDGLLLFFAWRKPAGFATWWIVLRLCVGAAAAFSSNLSTYCIGVGIFESVAAAVLVGLLAAMWGDLRRDKTSLLDAQQVMDTPSRSEARAALKRQAKVESRGYL